MTDMSDATQSETPEEAGRLPAAQGRSGALRAEPLAGSQAEPPAADAGHTPGAWWATLDLVGGYERQYGGPAIYATLPFSGGTLMVAEVLAGPIDRGEANARLIAAAPELLEALEAMQRAYFDFHDAHSLTQPVTGAAGNAMDMAIAAIAKARGL